MPMECKDMDALPSPLIGQLQGLPIYVLYTTVDLDLALGLPLAHTIFGFLL